MIHFFKFLSSFYCNLIRIMSMTTKTQTTVKFSVPEWCLMKIISIGPLISVQYLNLIEEIVPKRNDQITQIEVIGWLSF